MANIKFLSGYVSKVEAAKLKSFYIAKFKKEGRKDLKVVVENSVDFKIKGSKVTGEFIVVAYLKAELVKITKKIIEPVAETVLKVIKKVKAIKIKLPKTVFIPTKRIIHNTVATLKQKWVWKFIKSPLKLAS